MKILFCSEFFWPYIGGAERLGAQLVADLQKGGYDVTVMTSHAELALPDETCLAGSAILRYPFRRVLSDGQSVAIMKIRREVENRIKSLAPDLIHLYSIGAGLFYLRDVVRRARVPVVVTLHSQYTWINGEGGNTVLADTLKAASWVSGCSRAVLDQACKSIPEIRERSSVIRNGFDIGDHRSTPVPTKPMTLLCIGRLVPAKGFDTAISTFNAVHQRFPDVRLEIAGTGPERGRLEKLVASYGLGNAVCFLGQVPPNQVPSVIDRASIVLMPSKTEGLPVAAIEAALVGRPIVATHVNGIPEIVRHGTTGTLTQPGNLQEFIEATKNLLAAPERALEMGRAAREYARTQFSWPAYRNAHFQLYDRLHQEYGRPRRDHTKHER